MYNKEFWNALDELVEKSEIVYRTHNESEYMKEIMVRREEA